MEQSAIDLCTLDFVLCRERPTFHELQTPRSHDAEKLRALGKCTTYSLLN